MAAAKADEESVLLAESSVLLTDSPDALLEPLCVAEATSLAVAVADEVTIVLPPLPVSVGVADAIAESRLPNTPLCSDARLLTSALILLPSAPVAVAASAEREAIADDARPL